MTPGLKKKVKFFIESLSEKQRKEFEKTVERHVANYMIKYFETNGYEVVKR